MKKKCMYGMIIVLLIFLSGCAGSSIFSRTPDVSINANDLKQSYTSNELETIVELGDYIEITGVISFISSDEDEVKIQLYGDVLCSVTSNTESVEELELHNKIVLTGTIDGFTEDGKLVLVKKCKLVEVVTKPDIVTEANDISNLDFDETAYNVIKVTGVILYEEDGHYTDWSFLVDGENNNIDIFFNNEADLSNINSDDTITIIGVIVPYRDFITNARFRIYNSQIVEE